MKEVGGVATSRPTRSATPGATAKTSTNWLSSATSRYGIRTTGTDTEDKQDCWAVKEPTSGEQKYPPWIEEAPLALHIACNAGS
jgi:hypothetical protein